MKKDVKVRINNHDYELEVAPNETLLELLRDRLGLTGTKVGCNTGDCGACTGYVKILDAVESVTHNEKS